MSKATLFVLAAGMGSRYGGLKQLDHLGPSGETIMDYSVYDAIRAGFNRLVFVIRRSFDEAFRNEVIVKYKDKIEVAVVYQELDALPDGFELPAGREKPWGTNHAVLMAKDVIKEPFAVINADDFYGRHSFEVLREKLARMEGKQGEYCMVGYRVGNTLSERGGVSRGVCEVNEQRNLSDVVERIGIERIDGRIVFKDENGIEQELHENTPVSMNMWGFTPEYFEHSERMFIDFLRERINEAKSEYFIPTVVNYLIKNNKAEVEVLDTTSEWFGVTYAEDRPSVVAKLQALVDAGEYPSKLF